jgi:hypothetical protein
MNCQSYYPDRLDEETEFGICLNDSDFEPHIDELLEKQNFNCCKELIARKRFDGNKEVCQDFEMAEIKEDPILEQGLEELAKDDNINEETVNEIFLAYSVRNRSVGEYPKKLQSPSSEIRVEAIETRAGFASFKNKGACELLVNFFRNIPPSKSLQEVHFKIKVFGFVERGEFQKELVPILIKDLHNTSSNNTTRQWITEIFRFFQRCSIEDMREPLEKMLKEKCFSYRIKNKIKEILEEPQNFLF